MTYPRIFPAHRTDRLKERMAGVCGGFGDKHDRIDHNNVDVDRILALGVGDRRAGRVSGDRICRRLVLRNGWIPSRDWPRLWMEMTILPAGKMAHERTQHELCL